MDPVRLPNVTTEDNAPAAAGSNPRVACNTWGRNVRTHMVAAMSKPSAAPTSMASVDPAKPVDAAREINDVIYVIGQTLGTGSGPIVVDRDVFVKDPALAKDVQISKNPSPTPTPTPTPAVTTTAAAATPAVTTTAAAANIPQTGDELPLMLITVCIIAAGAAMWLTHRRIA